MTEGAFDSVILPGFTMGGILTFSNELARSSSPDAQAVLQADLIASVVAMTDSVLLSPAFAAVAQKNPASITNLVTGISSTGITAAAVSNDLRTCMNAVLTGGGQLTAPVWITTPRIKFALAMLRDSQNSTAFPEVALNGTLGGAPILTSTSIPSSISGGGLIVLLDAAELLWGDEGIELSVSHQAAIQSDSAPSTGAQNAISLFSNNLTGVKVTRALNFAPRRAAAMCCSYIDAVTL